MCKSIPVLTGTWPGLGHKVTCDCSEGRGMLPVDALEAWMLDVDKCAAHVKDLVKGLVP